jgi:hypothetical protein
MFYYNNDKMAFFLDTLRLIFHKEAVMIYNHTPET